MTETCGPVVIGLVGAGAMGSALGANWLAGGASVRTCLVGRSERTRSLAASAGLGVLDSLDDVVRSDVVVSVVPPAQALGVAHEISAAASRTGAAPIVVDLNAVAPSTLKRIDRATDELRLVDGSISGAPPSAHRPTRVYLSGPQAGTVAAIASPWLDVVVLPGGLGAASALKMCTASMYKGSKALVAQAMATADHYGVLDEFLADVARQWPDDVPGWPTDVALAASKSARYVGEMREIAQTQRSAGASGALFDGVAAAFARISRTPLGRRAPETVNGSEDARQVIRGLSPDATPAAVVFDFSGTLFYIESAEQALLAALGPGHVRLADELRRWGAVNGSSTPEVVPDELTRVWADRDLSAADHRAAYAGLSRHAGLSAEQSDALYERGVAPEAWTPFRETLPMLRQLHDAGVPVVVLSNIGWDPRPVLALHGAEPYVDALVLSYEHGVQKPDPAIFRIACDAVGVDPASAVMVGDNPEADGAAVGVGMRFALVAPDPAGRRGDELARAVGGPGTA